MNSTQSSMVDYYARRASEYEQIYQRQERQSDLRKLEALVSKAFRNHDVLEVASGTGYWTQFIAKQARSILATDYNPEVIEIARQKDYRQCTVSFQESDAYPLSNVRGEYSAGFCGFWWSHVPKSRVTDFIKVFHSKLQDHALVILIDNAYVDGNSTPISRRDEEGNTYQVRTLEDGSKHEVLKNFPSETELTQQLSPYAIDITFRPATYYWLTQYKVCKNVEQRAPANG